MKTIESLKQAKNILENLMPEYNPLDDEPDPYRVCDHIVARANNALFFVNGSITEADKLTAQNAELLAALENAATQIESLALTFQSHGHMGSYDRALLCAFDARAAIAKMEAGEWPS